MSISRRGLFALAVVLASAPSAHAAAAQADTVARGEYLARAGDCFGCHAAPGGAVLAGGRQIATPYGTIGAPNITPDPDTGIGKWTDDDFYRLMHDGIARDGHYIYPVMPFDHYTRVSRADVLAIKAFLFAQQPVHAPRPPNHLMFPLNFRIVLAGWRTLFFRPGSFAPDPALSAAQNRGAYLVEGLGHCGSCHTPRDPLSGSEQGEDLGGGEIAGQGWFAPNITSDVQQGVGGWSEQQLAGYLRTGVAPGHALAAGPMKEAIHDSLQYLKDDDLHAIAAYLKAVPAQQLYAAQHGSETLPGAIAYLTYCTSCHQPDGKGIAGSVPALAGNGVVKAGGPQDVIRTILGGLPAQGQYAPMPGLASRLSSAQVAQVADYVRSAWGNDVPPGATVQMVDHLGQMTHTMLAGTGPCDPVAPSSLAAALQRPGLAALLHAVNQADMPAQVDAIVSMLHSDGVAAPQADLVNGLTAAYCRAATAEAGAGPAQVQLLQRFAMLVHARLAAHDLSTAGD